MRVIIYGAGAVGSVLGGRLAQSGADVVMVARPAHVDAIAAGGLRLRTAHGVDVITVPAVTSLDSLTPGPDDMVLITAKTQDTPLIHDALLAWNASVRVVCGTNGVEHERMALRRFRHVYAMVIQLPAQFEKPGEVTALFGPTNALVDVGRYPTGVDATVSELVGLLATSPAIECEPDPAVMVKKHAKLLMNLTNAADGACGLGGRRARVAAEAIAEGRLVYEAAGIVHEQRADLAAHYAARLATMKFQVPEGDTFLGGSTWQSLAKGATSLETDYFNGEILLHARLHGIATPANDFLLELSARMLHERIPAGFTTVAQLDADWEATLSGRSAP